MAAIRVLLAGESWVSTSTHVKGWDFFSSSAYEVGTEYLEQALAGDAFDFVHLPGHDVAKDFPLTLDELNQYDVVLLSDVGANTMLLHPDTWVKGESVPNRLTLLKAWVEGGGGLAMCGGYLSFAGIYGSAKYYRTAIEQILPVIIHTFDDRVEVPEGAVAHVANPNHPILEGISGTWPALLGYNELVLRADAELIASVGNHPLLAAQPVGEGRTLIWASDIGPHWCPPAFLSWDGYGRIWRQTIEWLAGKR
jgi:uncharacterized membrane protein